MKSIPELDRPYEKCMQRGVSSLTDTELLAVILRSGTKGENVIDLSRHILYDDDRQGILGIHQLTFDQLVEMKGIGKVKAVQILCISELAKRLSKKRAEELLSFNDPSSIAEYYM